MLNRVAMISGWLTTVVFAVVFTWQGSPLGPPFTATASMLGVIALSVRNEKK
jgi:hypothetical protein